MSASSKKQLRKDQNAAKLTERQQTELKEAKKLKLYTIAFVAAVALMLVIAIVVGVNQTITASGVREKNTVALTVGDHQLSNAELNYFYIDTVNNFYSQYSSYAAMFGLDLTKPLNEQISNEETGATWADDFLDSAKSTAQATYALTDAAEAAGFTMPEATQAQLDLTFNNISAYAKLYGYEDAEGYLKAMYGNGATLEGYKKYATMTSLADAYNTAYGENLTYTDADLRAAEEGKYVNYSSFTYNSYYLSTSKFLEGGTTDDEGTITYSDEEKAASVQAAEEAANSLIGEEITTLEELDAAIAALPINAETTASSTAYEDTLYTKVNTVVRDWVADDSRAEGDMTVIPANSTDAEGNETVNGYYVVYFVSSNDNEFALKNVRHILVSFEGGTTDENGSTTYSDEEKAAAKTAAEELLAQWKSGEATEDSFAALANEESSDGDGTTGGLYEDIYPGQMVANFESWCYDDSRKAGDTGIVETEYGYHVMYFVGNSELTYRDYQIENELRSEDLETWYTETVNAMTVTDGDTKYLSMDLVLSNG